jgi:hypothetical protein
MWMASRYRVHEHSVVWSQRRFIPNRPTAEGEAMDVARGAYLNGSMLSVTGWAHMLVHRIAVYPRITSLRFNPTSFLAYSTEHCISKNLKPSLIVSKGLPE